MPQPGGIRPGSYADRVLATVRAAERPLSRAELIAAGLERRFLNRALDCLIAGNHLRECALGFRPFDMKGWGKPILLPEQPAAPERDMLAPVPEALRLQLDAIVRRAHALAGIGEKSAAVLLLNTVSRHPNLPAHVCAGMGALADLFRHHEIARAA